MKKSDYIICYNYIVDQFLRFAKEETVITRRLKSKTIKSFKTFIDQFLEDQEDLMAVHCVKGDKGQILYDEKKDFQFTVEGRLAFKKAIKELKDQTIEPDIVKVDWNLFTEEEKKYVVLDDELTYNTCKLFINGLPERGDEPI